MNSSYEMATPISNLQLEQIPQNTNVNNLVKTVETNIDTLNKPLPSNPLQYNPKIEIPQQQQLPIASNNLGKLHSLEEPKEIPPSTVKTETEESKSLLESFKCNIKEFIIIILLFSLLAHKKINKLFLFNIPFLSAINSPLPSLLFRGFLFAIVLFLIKYFI